MIGQGRVEDLVDQAGLAGAGDAGDEHQASQGQGDVDIGQVVLGRLLNRDPGMRGAWDRTAGDGDGNAHAA